MDDHTDPFREIVDDGEDSSVVDELGFYLNQFANLDQTYLLKT